MKDPNPNPWFSEVILSLRNVLTQSAYLQGEIAMKYFEPFFPLSQIVHF